MNMNCHESVVLCVQLMRCGFCFSTTHPVNKKPTVASINRSESYKERVQKVSELQIQVLHKIVIRVMYTLYYFVI
jgi:hypothetical protein